MIDLQTLQLGEVAYIEKMTERSITELGGEDTPKGSMLIALCVVTKKRQGEKFTWSDGEKLTMAEANEILGLGAAEDADPNA